ncbi:hypothetical protein PR048_003631 [Dryococelus australis]|uniref:Uncharacterized protein n=1 Tax=Dryococelus australis TaxID=614101 RepID=A0ABQ9INP0_9NEOP|nr:hypothetical protein PR048_003631 [Dryococelus australis]
MADVGSRENDGGGGGEGGRLSEPGPVIIATPSVRLETNTSQGIAACVYSPARCRRNAQAQVAPHPGRGAMCNTRAPSADRLSSAARNRGVKDILVASGNASLYLVSRLANRWSNQAQQCCEVRWRDVLADVHYRKNASSVGGCVRSHRRPIGPYLTGHYRVVYSVHHWLVIDQWRAELISIQPNRNDPSGGCISCTILKSTSRLKVTHASTAVGVNERGNSRNISRRHAARRMSDLAQCMPRGLRTRAATFRKTHRLLASHQGEPGPIPGRVPLDFRMWESGWTMPLVSGFSRRSPVSPTHSLWRCSILTSYTLIGSQDLDIVSRLAIANWRRDLSGSDDSQLEDWRQHKISRYPSPPPSTWAFSPRRLSTPPTLRTGRMSPRRSLRCGMQRKCWCDMKGGGTSAHLRRWAPCGSPCAGGTPSCALGDVTPLGCPVTRPWLPPTTPPSPPALRERQAATAGSSAPLLPPLVPCAHAPLAHARLRMLRHRLPPPTQSPASQAPHSRPPLTLLYTCSRLAS